jgi:anion-transporting  ArsA/GET3 family ATPase
MVDGPTRVVDLARGKKVLVCVGPGGVGKTTTAAALGALAARLGRRTLVCTIDPAPRLADALGVSLGPDPRPVPAEACRALGIDGERYFAVRLDTPRAFATLVNEQVADPEVRRRIFSNPIYQQITTTLTGSQEYAATLALNDFATRGEYDLVVLDTPPTANALDFLDAPKRIEAAVSSPALRWLMTPAHQTTGRFSLHRLASGSGIVLRRLGKFVGSQVIGDVGAFLVDFQIVLAGFVKRAGEIDHLLRGPDVAFLLVLAPEVAAIDEAMYFHGRLREARIPLGGFVANRVHAAPGLDDAGALEAALGAQPGARATTPEILADVAARLADIARGAAALHASERRELARLATSAPGVPITEVPLLDREVDNIAELRSVGRYLES